MDRHSTVANLSCMPSQITEMSARVAGVHLRQVSGSAGNVCSFQLRDGLTYATVGQLYDSKGQSNGYHKLPYVRATSGLYAQATGSATGTSWACYYVEDEESGTVSDTPSLMFESTSLVPTIGSATVAATRSTTVTALDNTPALKTAQINEIGVPGARRVRNLFALSDAPATQNVTTTAETYVLQASGTGTITLSGTYVGSLVVAGNRKRLAFTATAGTLTLTLSGGTPTWVQLERTTGAADTTLPSEYVSTSLAAPWHGAGVLDVKYFTTANGCTVDGSDVVTEATGAALTGVKGVLVERAITASSYSRDFSGSGGAWSADSSSFALTGTGLDGVANSCTTITCAATTATHGFYRLLAPADNTVTTMHLAVYAVNRTWVYLSARKKSGATTYFTWFDLTNMVFGTTSGSTTCRFLGKAGSFYNFSITFDCASGATTPFIGGGIAPSDGVSSFLASASDKLVVDFANVISESTPSSFVSVAAGTFNRTAPSYQIATCPPYLQSGRPWTVLIDFVPNYASSQALGENVVVWQVGSGTDYYQLYLHATDFKLYHKLVIASSTVFDAAGAVLSYTLGSTIKVAAAYDSTNGYAVYFNGASYATNATTTSAEWSGLNTHAGATGTTATGSQTTKRARYFASRLSNARLVLETT